MSQQTSKANNNTESSVVEHYSVSALGDRIMEGLGREGKSAAALTHNDLAAVDEFHIRGREATRELALLAELATGKTVLDIGSGIGGSARYLAGEFGCLVSGIDLTPDYCALATELSARVGLKERTSFRQGSALDMPFHDASFDVVWTEHVQMNIADKQRFYREAARVLRPGGALVFHDVFAGPQGGLAFPVPWSTTEDTSFLVAPEVPREILASLGLSVRRWIDCTERSREWFEAALERNAAHGPPNLGLHLVMGPTAKEKFKNVITGLQNHQLTVVQAVYSK